MEAITRQGRRGRQLSQLDPLTAPTSIRIRGWLPVVGGSMILLGGAIFAIMPWGLVEADELDRGTFAWDVGAVLCVIWAVLMAGAALAFFAWMVGRGRPAISATPLEIVVEPAGPRSAWSDVVLLDISRVSNVDGGTSVYPALRLRSAAPIVLPQAELIRNPITRRGTRRTRRDVATLEFWMHQHGIRTSPGWDGCVDVIMGRLPFVKAELVWTGLLAAEDLPASGGGPGDAAVPEADARLGHERERAG